MTISKIHKCAQCGELQSRAHFYKSTKDVNDILDVCITCFKKNRAAGIKAKGHDIRSRREREHNALNHKRDKRIKAAQYVYDEYDKRARACITDRSPIDVRKRSAKTYQNLKRQLDEAKAEVVL